jgi:peptidyl-prolyl cis-trans isomerase SurA
MVSARPTVCLTMMACLVTGIVAAQEASQQTAERVADSAVAQVGGTLIPRSALDAVLARIGTLYPGAAPPGVDASAALAPAGRERQLYLQASALEQLVDEALLWNELDRNKIAVATGEIDEGLARLKTDVTGRGMEWAQFLARAGQDETAVRRRIALDVGLEKLIRPQLHGPAMDTFFERHRRDVDGTRLRVSHIVLRPNIGRGEESIMEAMELAEQIRSSILRAETTFEDAARRHSTGPSRQRGGDLGWITRQGPFTEDFARQAYALGKGEVSKPFPTPFGVHVVKVTEVDPGQLGIEAARAKLEPLVAAQLLRQVLAAARANTPVAYAAGVPHFDPATPAEGGGQRRILVGAPGPARVPGPEASGP